MRTMRWLLYAFVVAACSAPPGNGGSGGGGATGGGSSSAGGGSAGGGSGGGAAGGSAGGTAGGSAGGAAGGSASGAAGGSAGGAAGGSAGGAAGGSAGGAAGGSGGGGSTVCTATAPGPTRGSAIAVSSDDAHLLTVNRDSNSVTAMSVTYPGGGGDPVLASIAELPVGAEPWQVVLDACNATAYVVLRADQKVVEIRNATTAPAIGRAVNVGSEPTALALTPNNTKLYVSSWVEGTLTVIDTATMTVSSTVDLNATLAATGYLGAVTPRPALAHPRGLAITNNANNTDDDETVYVTEWFAQRTAPEMPPASDTRFTGLLYKVGVGTGTASVIALPPVMDTGFNDAKGATTGCFPNQIASVTLNGGFAYVTSTCASPVGPLGVFQKGACMFDSQCAGGLPGSCVAGACKGSCSVDSDCGVGSSPGACDVANGGVCRPLTANVKTTTHPALSIVDLAQGTATTTNLDHLFATPTSTASGMASTRMPLLLTDVGFSGIGAYLTAEGADAVFRLGITNGAITQVGTVASTFIDLHPATLASPPRLPIGIAMAANHPYGFVANDGTRDVIAISTVNQAIAQGPAILSSSALPLAGSAADRVLSGKRFFSTGLGRWSLAGGAWGSCAACHIDGLTDNVTWYFARGPRQTISLDGTFAKNDYTDQRILNWTGIFDEIADFESNVRGVSGGVGAIVSTTSTSPLTSDRIDLLAMSPPQQGLTGSSTDVSSPDGGSSHPHSVIDDWSRITAYVQQLRPPKPPVGLNSADVMAGSTLFADPSGGACAGCHGGPKWTLSKVFYTPGDTVNDAYSTAPAATSLSGKSWAPAPNGFPMSLYPSMTTGKQTMRSGVPANFEQLQCVLRPVGTIGTSGTSAPSAVAPPAVGGLEVRQDMATGAQGAGTGGNDFTRGFNPPALTGLQVGAPYFHAGNARTLEELFSGTFSAHHQSLSPLFSPGATQVKQLVAFLLSIDAATTTVPLPTPGMHGGDLCAPP